MLRAFAVLLMIGGPAHADGSTRLDEFGCAILDRSDELTFSTFRDACKPIHFNFFNYLALVLRSRVITVDFTSLPVS